MMQTISEDLTRGPSCHLRLSGPERGVALILVLILSTIGLLVMTTVLYVIIMGTQLSGSEKRYRTAHEAALGGIDVLRKIIQDQSASTLPGVTINYFPNSASFTSKLTGTSLASYDTKITIDPNNSLTYDLYMEIGSPIYRVYAKLIQKQQGNTQKGYITTRLKTGVLSLDNTVGGQVNYSYYTFTLLAQKAANPNERVRMDLVHIF